MNRGIGAVSLLFARTGVARAEEPACHEALIRAVAQRHANLTPAKQFKSDYAVARRDMAKLNQEVVQVTALEENREALAALSPRCLEAVRETFEAIVGVRRMLVQTGAETVAEVVGLLFRFGTAGH